MSETISPFMRGVVTRKSNGELTAPDNIIASLSGAYNQYSILRQDHVERIELYAALEGCAAGNPPYDQAELDANGLGHKANYNDFKFRSYYERGAQAYWNLINGTDVFVKLWLNGKFPQVTRWASIMARNLSDVLKEWEDFKTNMNLIGMQLTKFGLCPIFWPDEKSFMFEVIDVSKFLIPSQTQTVISKLTNCCIESTYTIQKLYQIYTKLKDEPTSNWSSAALESFLIYKANSLVKSTTQFTNFLDVQRLIDNHDGVSNQFFNDSVRLVHLFQEEYDGKISHYMFDRDRLAASGFNSTEAIGLLGNDFLFFADRQYEKMIQAVQILTASPGEWTIHANLGIGQKTFAGTQATNMLSCTIFDMAIMSATPLIRTLATGGRDTNAIKFISGSATDIGAAEFVQNNLGANINQLVLGSQYITQQLDTNAVNSGDDPGSPDRSQGSISPSQARSRDFKEFGVLKNTADHFYTQMDPVLHNILIRLMECGDGDQGHDYKEEWIRRCEEDDIPLQFFDTAKKGFKGLPRQFRSVKVSRVAGDGSTLARIMGLEALQPIAGTFNAEEMAAYKKDYVEATLGPDYVETYASSDSQPDEQDGGASLAAVENFMMQQGEMPTFSADNEQAAHAATHMALNTHTIQQLQQQQISPIDANKIFEVSIPHTQAHIQAMEKAPLLYRDALQRIVPVFNQILKLAELNKKNAEAMVQAAQKKAQEDAAKTQGVMTDAQRKDFVAQKDAERADQKQVASIDRNKETVKQRGEIMKDAVEKKAETDRLKVELEADAKNATAQGRSKQQLESKSPEQLAAQSSGIIGATPSSVDFESHGKSIGFDRVPVGPAITDVKKVSV